MAGGRRAVERGIAPSARRINRRKPHLNPCRQRFRQGAPAAYVRRCAASPPCSCRSGRSPRPRSRRSRSVYEAVIEDEVSPVRATGSERFVESQSERPPNAVPKGIAALRPVPRARRCARAALVDVTDSRYARRSSPRCCALSRASPTLEMIECPGTEDDRANLRLGRMIRARGHRDPCARRRLGAFGRGRAVPGRGHGASPTGRRIRGHMPGPTRRAASPATMPPMPRKTAPISTITAKWA